MTIHARMLPRFAVLVAALAAASPAVAANKEHQQLAADIRMLQEQTQQLQNLIGQIAESIKAVNTRLDEQTNAQRKAFADQKLLIDALTNDLRVVREKVDDNNVRISSLTQELDQLRQMMQQAPAPAVIAPTAATPGAPATPGTAQPATGAPAPAGIPAGGTSTTGTPAQTGTSAPATPPPAAATLGMSPQRYYDMAWSDYTAGQWELAIQGYGEYIRAFPKSDLADDAQVQIGRCYVMEGEYAKAVDAFDTAIRTYPTGDKIADAYYLKGLAQQTMKQPDAARQAFEFLLKTYPDSPAATLARQRLEQMKK